MNRPRAHLGDEYLWGGWGKISEAGMELSVRLERDQAAWLGYQQTASMDDNSVSRSLTGQICCVFNI